MDVVDGQFEEFVVARTPALLRFAYALTSDVALAEDLVQEALLKAARRWRLVLAADRPEAYVRRIIVNEYNSWRRLRRNSETPTGHVPDRAGLEATETALVERDAMWRALAGLPRRQRAAVVLRFYEDLSDTQVADVLGCSPATARSLTSRALQSLRSHDPATAPTPGGQT